MSFVAALKMLQESVLSHSVGFNEMNAKMQNALTFPEIMKY